MHPLLVLALGLAAAWAVGLYWRTGWAAPASRWLNVLLAGAIIAALLGGLAEAIE